MKRHELTLRTGGLYRCCMRTFDAWVSENPEAEAADGETITCRYEPSQPQPQMIVHKGVVQWNDPDYPPLP